MLDGELTLSVFPDLCVGVSLTPFENAKAFLEAGVDEFGETDRSTSASLDAAESAFRVRGGVSVESGSFSFPGAKSDDRLTLGADVTLTARARGCLLYTSPSPRDGLLSRMPSSA